MGSAVGELTGANKRAAKAAGRAARAQQAAAQEALVEAQSFGKQAIDAARGTPDQIRQMEAALANQEQNIQREEKLLSSIDPALMEASSQVLKLLRGEEASIMDPVKQDRARKRQQLVSSLREQFGPGAESSSAGIQALTAFDAETSNVMASAQQQSIGQLFGAQASLLPSVSNARGLAASRLAGTLGTEKDRMSSAFMSAGQLVGAARGGTVSTAGARHVQSAMRAQQMQGIGSDAFRAAMAFGTGGMSELGSGISNLFGGGSTTLSAGTSGMSQFGSPSSESLMGVIGI